MKFVNLGDSCTVGGDHAMNIIIARVPVLNVSELILIAHIPVHTTSVDLVQVKPLQVMSDQSYYKN